MSSGRPARRSRSAVSRRDRFHGAAEDDEAADAEVERVGDAGGLVAEAAVGRRAQRGEKAGRDRAAEGSCRSHRAEDACAAALPWRRGRCPVARGA